MRPKGLQERAAKLGPVSLNQAEQEDFAVASYLNAREWKGRCIGLAIVAILSFLAALK